MLRNYDTPYLDAEWYKQLLYWTAWALLLGWRVRGGAKRRAWGAAVARAINKRERDLASAKRFMTPPYSFAANYYWPEAKPAAKGKAK